jgi:hypothetical protein
MNSHQAHRRPHLLAWVIVCTVFYAGRASGDTSLADKPRILRWTDASNVERMDCDVIVVGGSTAALAAALTAAREGHSTCLTEPTEWPGGQLTAGGVPAVDYAWHKRLSWDVGAIGKNPRNLPEELLNWMQAVASPGSCWVSQHCFEPRKLLRLKIEPAVSLRTTVVKELVLRTSPQGERILGLLAIERQPREGREEEIRGLRLSQVIRDWYSPLDSPLFRKKLLYLTSSHSDGPIVIDASEFGEVLALSDAAYTQGVEQDEGDPSSTREECGQAFTYGFVLELRPGPEPAMIPDLPVDHPLFYDLHDFTWERVWTYRRLHGKGHPAVGDLSLQNWNPGNDWPFSPMLLPRAATAETRIDWEGGVDIQTLDAAERHAYGWARWYLAHAPAPFAGRIRLNRSTLGTGHGLSRFPYVRDTRRSIGLDGFRLTLGDLSGPETARTGQRFMDRIAIGTYNADIHGMEGCDYPPYDSLTLPFYIPLRALTNATVVNLLLAGKTMAQTFLANAATRLHPIEFASGIGAGAAASVMVRQELAQTRDLLPFAEDVQKIVIRYAPIDFEL